MKFILIFLLSSNCFCQFFLDIPKVGQKRGNWCWAGSLEMILKYNQYSNFNQCQIYNKMFVSNQMTSIPCECCSYSDTCTNNTELFLITTTTNPDTLNNKISTFFSDIQTESVIESFGSNLDWNLITREIDRGQPILINVNRDDFDGTIDDSSSGHVMVINGYYELSKAEKYIAIKDPWKPCFGCEYLLKYPNFADSDGSFTSILSYAYNFYQKPTTIPIQKPSFNPICNNANLDLGIFKQSTFKKNDFLDPYLDIQKCIPKSICEVCSNNSSDYKKILVYELNRNDISQIQKESQIDIFSKKHFLFIDSKSQKPFYYNFVKKVSGKNYQRAKLFSNIRFNVCQLFSTEYYYLESLGDFCTFFIDLVFADYQIDPSFALQSSKIEYIITIPSLNYIFNCFKENGKIKCYSKKRIPELGVETKKLYGQEDLLLKIQNLYSSLDLKKEK